MAIAIKNIPTLHDKAASDFIKKAEIAAAKRSTIDFREKVATAQAILQKAKMI